MAAGVGAAGGAPAEPPAWRGRRLGDARVFSRCRHPAGGGERGGEGGRGRTAIPHEAFRHDAAVGVPVGTPTASPPSSDRQLLKCFAG